MSFWSNIADSFGSLGTAFRHTFFGYSDKEKPKVKETLTEAQKRVDKNKENNGGKYSVVESLGITNPLGGIKDSIDWLIISIVALLAFVFLFRD